MVGTIDDPHLVEVSGIAVSAANPGVLWANNDSGDGPWVYALTTQGAFLGGVHLEGASADDWEDLAIGPCDGGDCIYAGDIGDNPENRPSIRIYRLSEPQVDPAQPFGEAKTIAWEQIDLAYPDGPHDAEALVVGPDAALYVITKEVGTARVYRNAAWASGGKATLELYGELAGLPIVTAADLARDGARLVVRGYGKALEWRGQQGAAFTDLLAAAPIEVPLGEDEQGEAIGYDPFAGGYLHTSEGEGQPLYRISCAAP